jgi:hypothetical protein
MALTEDRKALVETILNTLREDPSLLEEFRRLLVPEIVVFLPDLKLIGVVCVENGRVDPLDWDTILTLWQPNKGT